MKTVKKSAKKTTAKSSATSSKKKSSSTSKGKANKLPETKLLKSDKTKSDEAKFPGYPLYAEADDIMNRATKVDSDVEYASAPKTTSHSPTPPPRVNDSLSKSRKRKDDSDLTKDDYKALGSESDNLEMDGGDDEELVNRTTPVDFAGKDLDIPSDDEDGEAESIGSEDEENKSYSLGGDDHNDLEEDQA